MAISLVTLAACIPPTKPNPTTTTTTTTTVVEPPWLEAGCIGTLLGVDFSYDGNPDSVGNLSVHSPADGTCSGASFPIPIPPLVRGSDLAEAGAVCLGLGRAEYANPLAAVGFDVPADAWMCVQSAAPVTVASDWLEAGCHDAPDGSPDVYFNGEPNTASNMTYFLVPDAGLSSDGTCTGLAVAGAGPGGGTIARGDDLTAAIAACAPLGYDSALALPVEDAPADAWMCVTVIPPPEE